MGKYMGYLTLIGGLIILAGKLYDLFYYYNLQTSVVCALGDYGCMTMKNWIGKQILGSVALSLLGLIIADWGWKDIQKNKMINNIADHVAENVTNVFRKYATPAGPKFNSVEEIDQYLENIDKNEDLDIDKILK